MGEGENCTSAHIVERANAAPQSFRTPASSTNRGPTAYRLTKSLVSADTNQGETNRGILHRRFIAGQWRRLEKSLLPMTGTLLF